MKNGDINFYELLKREIDAADIPIKWLAGFLRKGVTTMYCELSTEETPYKLGVDTWRQILQLTRRTGTLEMICRESGGVFVQLPPPDVGDDELHRCLSKTLREFADVCDGFSEIINPKSKGGGKITIEEAAVFAKKTYGLIAALLTFIKSVMAAAEGKTDAKA